MSSHTEHAEADTFFCFTSLMAEIGDMYTKKLDSAHLGIGSTQEFFTVIIYKRHTWQGLGILPEIENDYLTVEPLLSRHNWDRLMLT